MLGSVGIVLESFACRAALISSLSTPLVAACAFKSLIFCLAELTVVPAVPVVPWFSAVPWFCAALVNTICFPDESTLSSPTVVASNPSTKDPSTKDPN